MEANKIIPQKIIRNFNKQLLDTLADEFDVKLIGDYNGHLTRNTRILGYCISEECKEQFDKTFKNIVDIAGFYCNKCSVKNGKEKKKKTCKEKFGVEFISQSEEVKEKRKQTCREKYGVDFASQSEEVREKTKQTCQEKYGVDFSWQSTPTKEKIKQTNLVKFGVEYPLQCEEVKEKVKQTCQEIYGVDNPFQSQKIKDKMKETNLKRLGVEYPSQSEEVKEKVKQSNLKNYGVEYPSQNPLIYQKTAENSFRFKNYTLPSGKIIQYQGYENKALNELIQLYDEDDIIIGSDHVPECWYKNDNKTHRYFIDIFIPSQKLGIEVKSDYTFTLDNDIILLKQKAFQKLGYKCEIWIYTAKGKKTIV